MRALRQRCGPRWPAWLLLTAVQAGIAGFFLWDRSPGTAAALTGLPLDDAWIHLVYGRSLAQSGLPYYNEHELEAGFTSPLWVLVCAVAHWLAGLLGLNAVLALKILGTLCAVAMTWGVYELARICGAGTVGSFLAGLLSAMTPASAFSQISGMEVCLAAGLGLWAICAFQGRRYLTSGVLLALAFWTRPEMLVLWCVVLVMLMHEWIDDPSRANRAALVRVALPTLALGALWSGYCLAVTGRLLPNTFYAKFSSKHPQGFLTILREVVWKLPSNYLMAGAALYVLGLVQTIRRPAPARWIVLLFPWYFLFAIGASRSIPPGTVNYYYWLRYVVPALPFLYPIIAVGWRLLWPSLAATSTTAGPATAPARLRVAAIWTRRVITVLLALLCLGTHPQALRQAAGRYAWNCQNINEVQVVIGQWVAENTPPDAAIVVNDAGALRYLGQRRTIDLMGLNRHELAHDRRRLGRIIASSTAMRDFMQTVNAQYLIVFPPFFPGVLNDPWARGIFQELFHARSENYTLMDAPQDLMAVYRLRRHDSP